MNLVWATLIVASVTVVATTAMLLARRRAPEGSYFDRGRATTGRNGTDARAT